MNEPTYISVRKLDDSEPVMINTNNIAYIERKPIAQGECAVIHLDIGASIWIVERYDDVVEMILQR